MSHQSENVIKSLNISISSESSSISDMLNDFRERIRSYIDGQKWVKRPLVLSPDICSQYGWKCVKPDLLQCVTCSAKLCAHEPKIENFEAYKECINKLITDLKDSHRKHCPWPITPSPEFFVRMIPMPKEEALNQFLDRINPCLEFQSSLPVIAKSVMPDMGLIEKHIQSLCKIAKVVPETAECVGRSAVLLAATGWTITSKESFCEKTFITCEYCQRSAWSGSFILNSTTKEVVPENGQVNELNSNQKDVNAQKADTSDEPLVKKRKISNVIENEPFNPFYEHRPWCLWVSSKVQKSNLISKRTESFKDEEEELSHTPGWKIFVKSLLRNMEESHDESQRCSPSKEHIRSVRNMVETWADVQS